MSKEEVEEELDDMDKIWDKAIRNARKAFGDTFNEAGYDPAYWCLKIISHSMSIDFTDILETKTWDEYGNYNLKKLKKDE